MDITLAGTGHRPNKLWGYDLSHPSYTVVREALRDLINTEHVTHIISGMALGFDTILAQTAIELDIPLTCAVPFKGQESRWPAASQRTYHDILSKVNEIIIVCDGAYAPYKMQRRNEWMVDHADMVCTLWDGTDGGTANCVRYARSKGATIVRLDPRTVDNNARFKVF